MGQHVIQQRQISILKKNLMDKDNIIQEKDSVIKDKELVHASLENNIDKLIDECNDKECLYDNIALEMNGYNDNMIYLMNHIYKMSDNKKDFVLPDYCIEQQQQQQTNNKEDVKEK